MRHFWGARSSTSVNVLFKNIYNLILQLHSVPFPPFLLLSAAFPHQLSYSNTFSLLQRSGTALRPVPERLQCSCLTLDQWVGLWTWQHLGLVFFKSFFLLFFCYFFLFPLAYIWTCHSKWWFSNFTSITFFHFLLIRMLTGCIIPLVRWPWRSKQWMGMGPDPSHSWGGSKQ